MTEIEIDLDQKTIDQLEDLAAECNSTFNEVVNQALIDGISETITLSKFEAELRSETVNKRAIVDRFLKITTEDGQPICQVTPISTEE